MGTFYSAGNNTVNNNVDGNTSGTITPLPACERGRYAFAPAAGFSTARRCARGSAAEVA
jgi:hypothetical protein